MCTGLAVYSQYKILEIHNDAKILLFTGVFHKLYTSKYTYTTNCPVMNTLQHYWHYYCIAFTAVANIILNTNGMY